MLSVVGRMQNFISSPDRGSCAKKWMNQTSGVSASSLGKPKIHTRHLLSSHFSCIEHMVSGSAGESLAGYFQGQGIHPKGIHFCSRSALHVVVCLYDSVPGEMCVSPSVHVLPEMFEAEVTAILSLFHQNISFSRYRTPEVTDIDGFTLDSQNSHHPGPNSFLFVMQLLDGFDFGVKIPTS